MINYQSVNTQYIEIPDKVIYHREWWL